MLMLLRWIALVVGVTFWWTMTWVSDTYGEATFQKVLGIAFLIITAAWFLPLLWRRPEKVETAHGVGRIAIAPGVESRRIE